MFLRRKPNVLLAFVVMLLICGPQSRSLQIFAIVLKKLLLFHLTDFSALVPAQDCDITSLVSSVYPFGILDLQLLITPLVS